VNRKVRVPDALSGSIAFTPFAGLGAVAWTGPRPVRMLPARGPRRRLAG
jgi:hypothetical protein